MLILSRKLHEAIIINEDIEVIISHIDNDTVKIAIKAPRHIPIYRKEIFDSVLHSNKKSLLSPSASKKLKIPSSFLEKFKQKNPS